jgi:hypothetical protein
VEVDRGDKAAYGTMMGEVLPKASSNSLTKKILTAR